MCKRVLQAALERPVAAHLATIKGEAPKLSDQKCVDLNSVLKALNDGAAGMYVCGVHICM